MPPRNHWPRRPPAHAARRGTARASRWHGQAARRGLPTPHPLHPRFPAPPLHFRHRSPEQALPPLAWRAMARARRMAGICPALPGNRWPKPPRARAARPGTAQAKLPAKAPVRRKPPTPPHQFPARARAVHFRHRHRESRESAPRSAALIIVARARKLAGGWPVPPGNRWPVLESARAVPRGAVHPVLMAGEPPLARRGG